MQVGIERNIAACIQYSKSKRAVNRLTALPGIGSSLLFADFFPPRVLERTVRLKDRMSFGVILRVGHEISAAKELQVIACFDVTKGRLEFGMGDHHEGFNGSSHRDSCPVEPPDIRS